MKYLFLNDNILSVTLAKTSNIYSYRGRKIAVDQIKYSWSCYIIALQTAAHAHSDG